MHGLQACLFKYNTFVAFCTYLSVVKMTLEGEVGGHALKSWKLHCWSWKNHGIMFFNFYGNPERRKRMEIHLQAKHDFPTPAIAPGTEISSYTSSSTTTCEMRPVTPPPDPAPFTKSNHL